MEVRKSAVINALRDYLAEHAKRKDAHNSIFTTEYNPTTYQTFAEYFASKLTTKLGVQYKVADVNEYYYVDRVIDVKVNEATGATVNNTVIIRIADISERDEEHQTRLVSFGHWKMSATEQMESLVLKILRNKAGILNSPPEDLFNALLSDKYIKAEYIQDGFKQAANQHAFWEYYIMPAILRIDAHLIKSI